MEQGTQGLWISWSIIGISDYGLWHGTTLDNDKYGIINNLEIHSTQKLIYWHINTYV